MPRNAEISTEKRAQIVALYQSGVKQTDIAERLGVSQQVVSLTWRKYRDRDSFESAQRPGRPRATTPRTDTMVRRIATIHPSFSAKEIAAELHSPPSVRTIQRRLHDQFNLKARRPAKKPRLSPKNLRDRRAFCKKYANWTVDMWKRVLFSDESLFYQFKPVRKYVRRPPNTRYQMKYLQPTVKHSPSVMVWGCFSASGLGELYFLPEKETVNAAKYISILEEHLEPSLERLQCTVFQHDGAPCHTAKTVRAWLAQRQIRVLDWPGGSPDLNPIENLWNSIKERVATLQPRSLTHLKEVIVEVWNEHMTPAKCEKLVNSMPRRIKAVLKNKGGHRKHQNRGRSPLHQTKAFH